MSQYFHSFMERDVFDRIQMNCYCFDCLYRSVSAFAMRSVEGNKLIIACISYFVQFLREKKLIGSDHLCGWKI